MGQLVTMVDRTSQKMIQLLLVVLRISTSSSLIKTARIRTLSKSRYPWMTLVLTIWMPWTFSRIYLRMVWMAACKTPLLRPKNTWKETMKLNPNTSPSFLVSQFGVQMYRKKLRSNLCSPFNSWLHLILIELKILDKLTQRRVMKVIKRMSLTSFKEQFRSTLNNKWSMKNRWNCNWFLRKGPTNCVEQANSRIILRFQLFKM